MQTTITKDGKKTTANKSDLSALEKSFDIGRHIHANVDGDIAARAYELAKAADDLLVYFGKGRKIYHDNQPKSPVVTDDKAA